MYPAAPKQSYGSVFQALRAPKTASGYPKRHSTRQSPKTGKSGGRRRRDSKGSRGERPCFQKGKTATLRIIKVSGLVFGFVGSFPLVLGLVSCLPGLILESVCLVALRAPKNNLRGGFPGPSGPQPILGLFFRALRAPKQTWGGFPGPSGPRPILGLFSRALRAPKQSQGRVSGPFGLPHNLRVGFPRPSGPQTILGLVFRTLRVPNQS